MKYLWISYTVDPCWGRKENIHWAHLVPLLRLCLWVGTGMPSRQYSWFMDIRHTGLPPRSIGSHNEEWAVWKRLSLPVAFVSSEANVTLKFVWNICPFSKELLRAWSTRFTIFCLLRNPTVKINRTVITPVVLGVKLCLPSKGRNTDLAYLTRPNPKVWK
jgi:hypothetical protein